MNQLYHCLSIYPIVHTDQTLMGIQYAMKYMRRQEMLASRSLCCLDIVASHLRILLDILHLSLTRLLILDHLKFHTSQCQDKITWRLRRSDPSTQIIWSHYLPPFVLLFNTTTRHPHSLLHPIPPSHLQTIYRGLHLPLAPTLMPHRLLYDHTLLSLRDYSSQRYLQHYYR